MPGIGKAFVLIAIGVRLTAGTRRSLDDVDVFLSSCWAERSEVETSGRLSAALRNVKSPPIGRLSGKKSINRISGERKKLCVF